MDEMKSTPLLPEHEGLKALIAPFGGWNMPIQYEGIIAEHRWCREKAALFDICHMGEFQFRGELATSGLDEIFTFSVTGIPPGRCRYGFLLNKMGGIIDDLIVFRLGENEVMIVTNAATIDNDFAVIAERLKGGELRDVSAVTGKLDLQGPLSRDILVKAFGPEIATIPYFKSTRMRLLGVEAIVSRTGYTGELGYEIFIPGEKVVELWRLLLADERVKPAGLGARDLLRLEMGYSLYGNDIDEETTPLEAGLEAFVNFDKDFVGRRALLRQQREGLHRVKVAFRVASRRSPRHHYEIWHEGSQAGAVTSGAFSPMLGCGIGIGLVRPEAAGIGAPLTIRHGNVSMEATVCDLPFYTGGSLRS
ncbi:MAG TPA: glycine cleavage system aminomethyltransferase GcvT [Geobacteraceae bacterium]|nr:glycine cleavage system aminomethyltransferase GcvT [Geobacteraceae bacterium]